MLQIGIDLGKKLYYVPKPSRWNKGIGAELPEEYKKFWREWKLQQPAAVHYIEEKGKYKRNDITEEVYDINYQFFHNKFYDLIQIYLMFI